MTDYEVDVAIRKQLLLQLKVVGIDISVKAGFQSTKQGREDNMVMFFPINENGYGWQGRKYKVQGNKGKHQENQLYQKTKQVQDCVNQLGHFSTWRLYKFGPPSERKRGVDGGTRGRKK
ncbi:phage gateway protein, partial [Proteus mirabilis]